MIKFLYVNHSQKSNIEFNTVPESEVYLSPGRLGQHRQLWAQKEFLHQPFPPSPLRSVPQTPSHIYATSQQQPRRQSQSTLQNSSGSMKSVTWSDQSGSMNSSQNSTHNMATNISGTQGALTNDMVSTQNMTQTKDTIFTQKTVVEDTHFIFTR